MSEQNQIALYVNGGSRGNPGPAAGAYIVNDPSGKTVQSEGFFLGQTTTIIAEYTALFLGLQAVEELGIREFSIFSDSESMVKQIIGEYRVQGKELLEIFEKVQYKLLGFDRWQIKHIRREFNAAAEQLRNEAIDRESDAAVKTADNEILPERSNAATSQISEPTGETPAPIKILVEVLTESDEHACPSPMRKGQCFVFTGCVPAGLCTHAAITLLPTVIALQRDPASKSGTFMVKCCNPGCGAGFKVSVI